MQDREQQTMKEFDGAEVLPVDQTPDPSAADPAESLAPEAAADPAESLAPEAAADPAESLAPEAAADPAETVEDGGFKGLYEDTVAYQEEKKEAYPFYRDIMRSVADGTSTVELKKRYMIKAIDEKWIEKVEDCLPALDVIIRKPSKFIEETEEVLPIELSRNISSRSIQHLSQHTDYIAKVDGDEITPSRILNVFRDETMLTYENKFVNTLINRLYIFVVRRYDTALKQGKDEKTTTLDFSEKFNHLDVEGKINLKIEISEEPDENEQLKNYTYTTDLWHRVEKLYNVVGEYMESPFVKNMGKAFIRPPVIRTNAILKNKNLRQCLELWEFIESYENIGYDMLVQEMLEDVDEGYLKEIFSSTALQYLLFRYNIHNEFDYEKALAQSETKTPLSPTIQEELTPATAEEFDEHLPVEYREVEREKETFFHWRLKGMIMRNSVEVALQADRILRKEEKFKRPPRRSILGTILGSASVGLEKAKEKINNFREDHDKELKHIGHVAQKTAGYALILGGIAVGYALSRSDDEPKGKE